DRTDVLPTDHAAGIVQLAQERAARVDDQRPLPAPLQGESERVEPADPHLLHVAEIDGVVDMAERVHVAPSDRNLDFVYEDALAHRLPLARDGARHAAYTRAGRWRNPRKRMRRSRRGSPSRSMCAKRASRRAM